MRRVAHLVVAIVTLSSLLAASPVADAASAPADSATESAARPRFSKPHNYLRLFAETNGGPPSEQIYTRDQAISLAKRFDVIVALRWTFDDHVVAMKHANPRLRIVAYLNGAMSKASDRAGMPERWFLHDANGNRVRNLHFDLHYMDVGNRGWRFWVARRCGEWIRLSRFDGCFLDDMGSGNLGVNLSAWPIDPRTGQRMTEYNWISYGRMEQRRVRLENPGKLITSNGLNNGSNYFAPVRAGRMLDTAHASMAEGWLRGGYTPINTFRPVDRWKQDVDMLVDAGQRGRTALVATKLWTPHSNAQALRWREYAYASFLLGTNGYSFLSFDTGGPGKPNPRHRYDRLHLGRPTQHYQRNGRVYQRRFTNGIALVNPGDHVAHVDLGRVYVRPDGTRARHLTVGPHSGRLMRLP